jgi:hypothetical protein
MISMPVTWVGIVPVGPTDRSEIPYPMKIEFRCSYDTNPVMSGTIFVLRCYILIEVTLNQNSNIRHVPLHQTPCPSHVHHNPMDLW